MKNEHERQRQLQLATSTDLDALTHNQLLSFALSLRDTLAATVAERDRLARELARTWQ